MRPHVRSVAVVGLLLLASAPTAIARADGETCHGEPATIVGSYGQNLHGTDGRDVIVSNGAWYVDAGAGDDLICATGDGGPPGPSILGGDGDDTIDSTALDPSRGANARGGNGADTITTGQGTDYVAASKGGDQISTGDGGDYIYTGSKKSVTPDVIDAGAGDDWIQGQGSGWTADGGTGRNHLTLYGYADTGHWVVDATTGRATRNGTEMFRFSAVTDYLIELGQAAPGRLVFRGSDADETLGRNGPAGRLDVDMGGGDDLLTTDTRGVIHAEGGPGIDKLSLGPGYGDVDADLATGSVQVTGEDGTTEHTVTGFERFRFGRFGNALVRGSNGPDWITGSWTQCTTIRGRGGDDVLRATYWYHSSCRVRLLGGEGDDRLFGRDTNDILFGGPGADRADGDDGLDRCSAETRFSCEKVWPAE